MLAMMLTEHELYDEALATWELCQRLMPLVDKRMRLFVHSHLSHIHYLLGNIEESRRLAIESHDPMLEKVAQRLLEAREGQKRVHLRVPFIHQHYVTCAPTTMAMLGRFWKRTVEHLEIADEITYGGTAAHRERAWAEEHGWTTREFTLTWDAAVAILDRGVPFALTTVSGDRAHEQAVVGYDTHRDTLLARDPSSPGLSELDFESLLRTHQSSGPRAMIMLPRERASLIEGIELPEAAEHDLEHEMMMALDHHDRVRALKALSELEARSPGSRVTASARQTIAAYDRNLEQLLACVNEQLVAMPDDVSLLLMKTRCLHDLSRHAERTAMLETLTQGDIHHPLFLRLYADALSRDASRSETALQHVRRYLRLAAVDAEGFRVLAGIEWVLGRMERATRLYRLASCVADTHEGHAGSYFLAATLSRQADDALQFLRQRFERFEEQSSGPAQTLFWALCQAHRVEEAFDVITRAMAARPDDPELTLFAADASARFGRFDEANARLATAEPIARRADYLSAVGRVARYRGDLASALAAWTEVHELEPLSQEAHSAVSDLLVQVRGRKESLQFLERLVERFPTYQPAWGLLVSALRDSDPPEHEAAVRRMLEIAPNDAWARRELALALAAQRRYDEAFVECERAAIVEPSSSTNASVRGRVALLAQDNDAAKVAFNRALELSADEAFAIFGLADACRDGHERREVFAALFADVIERSSSGEGLLAAYPVAADALEADEVLELVRRAVATRGSLWQSHVALLRQLLRMAKKDEGVEAALEATRRFPMQPVVWIDAAEAFGAGGHAQKQQEALESAVQLEPTNGEAALALARLLMRREQDDRAIAVLEDAAARIPLDGTIQWILGGLLWDLDRKEEGLSRLRRAAEHEADAQS
jgi:tetratricopeptide (TPR) repeat protein